jgi:hypothetical protein
MSSTHSVPPRPRIAAIVVALVASAALFVTGVATIVRVEFLPFLLGAIITVLGFMVTDGIRLQRAAIPAEPRTEVAS